MRYCVLLLLIALPARAADAPAGLKLNLRSRVQPFKGSDTWEEVTLRKELPAKETALLICDMWDDHWCKPAAQRCGVLAKKMVPVLAAARDKGVLIIHAPSDCMDFYKDAPSAAAFRTSPRSSCPNRWSFPTRPCRSIAPAAAATTTNRPSARPGLGKRPRSR